MRIAIRLAKRMKRIIVEKIDELPRLNELSSDWISVYNADPHAHLYTSWLWFHSWAAETRSKWIVLALKDESTGFFIGFFPLSVFENRIGSQLLLRKLYFGGKDYSIFSGFLCLPEYEVDAISELARFMQKDLKWDVFSMNWIRDERIEAFAQRFPQSWFHVNLSDDLMSLRISLPEDYEKFLSGNMGKSTRKRTLEKIKHIQNEDHYQIRIADDESINEDIDALCSLWNARWNRKYEMEWHRTIMHQFYKHNLLRLTILRDRNKVIGGLACFADPEKKIYYAYITSYDPDYIKISPGIVLFVESIRFAIENGYKGYDLSVGHDPYKLSFGPEELRTKSLEVKRKRFRTNLLLKMGKVKKRVME